MRQVVYYITWTCHSLNNLVTIFRYYIIITTLLFVEGFRTLEDLLFFEPTCPRIFLSETRVFERSLWQRSKTTKSENTKNNATPCHMGNSTGHEEFCYSPKSHGALLYCKINSLVFCFEHFFVQIVNLWMNQLVTFH